MAADPMLSLPTKRSIAKFSHRDDNGINYFALKLSIRIKEGGTS